MKNEKLYFSKTEPRVLSENKNWDKNKNKKKQKEYYDYLKFACLKTF